MREMKDSGVEWIGCVPKDWVLNKGKFLFVQRNDRGNTICLQLLSPTQKYGVIPQDEYEELSGMKAVKLNEKVNLAELKTVHAGAYCISLRSFQGGFEYSNYEGVVSPVYQIFYPRGKVNDDYYKYLFKTEGFIQEMNSFTMSLRDGKNIAFEDFGNSMLPVPPLNEQNNIASFLDSKCAEIDALSADIQKEIETLQEYRKSVITEAVTKGLDPNVEMKDSGIEWLGYVPKAWGVRQLKSCVNILRGGSPRPINEYLTDDIDGLNWIKIGDTEKGKRYINSVRQKIKKSGLSKTRQVHRGDLLLTNSMSFGEPYILNVDGCIHDGWLVFTDIKEIDKEYLYYFLLSSTCKDQFSITADGGVVQNLNIQKVQSSIILLSVISEQHKIVNYLNTKCSEIDSIIADKQKQLETLAEYRKSLIYEYVTGKKEVPTA